MSLLGLRKMSYLKGVKMKNQFARPSVVKIHASKKDGKTVLKDVFFTSPYKIMNPFYRNGDFMTIMCMSASAGIMAGDIQEFSFTIDEGAKLEFISQSYEKIHKMEQGFACRNTEISVGKDACFYYNPMPTQPFKDSAYKSIVNVHLEDSSSQFIMKEIITGGRTLCGECFEYTFYDNLVNIYIGDLLVYRDNTRFHPEEMNLSGIGFHENFTHMGTLLLFHVKKDTQWIKQAQELLDQTPNLEGGVTRIDSIAIMIRVLGYQGEQLEQILDQIIHMSEI